MSSFSREFFIDQMHKKFAGQIFQELRKTLFLTHFWAKSSFANVYLCYA